jgi:PST family polysaccharide transporter
MINLRGAIKSSLFRNIVALYAVQICRKVIPIASIPYLTRVLGPTTWGTMSFVLTSVTFVIIFVEFGFGISATREIASNRDSTEARADVVAGVLGLQVLLFITGMTVLLLAAPHLPLLHNNQALLSAGLFYAVSQCFAPIWFFQGMEWMRSASALEISGKVISLGGLLLFVHSPGDAWLALALQGIPSLLQTAVGIWLIYREVPFRLPSVPLMRQTLVRGWTMFVFRNSVHLYTGANVFILGLFAKPEYVGYYAAAERINSALLGLLNPIQEAFFPRLNNLISHSPERAAKLARLGATVTAVLGILLPVAVIIAAPYLVAVLAGRAFAPAVEVLRILALMMPFAALTASIAGQWLLPMRKDNVVTAVMLAGGILNVTVACLLAPRFAHLGMASAAVISESFVGLTMIWALSRFTLWRTMGLLGIFTQADDPVAAQRQDHASADEPRPRARRPSPTPADVEVGW